MKKFRFIIAILILTSFFGCGYEQICRVSGEFQKTPADSVIDFENDTLKIVYYFWDLGGSMSFGIFNKLSVPIYINWQKSACIISNRRESYYQDETTLVNTSTASSMQSTDYRRMLAAGASVTTVSKADKISFIAPHSYISRVGPTLWEGAGAKLPDSSPKLHTHSLNDDSIPAQIAFYPSFNSPLRFRNFLTYSTTEDFQHEQYVDNGFFLSITLQIKQKYFTAEAFKNPCKFYIPAR
jgi:hypothetical protein